MPEPGWKVSHRRWPCDSCPWRTDATGVRKTYPNLAAYAEGTIGRPGAEIPLNGLLFACHMSRASPHELCAGWMAVAGRDHLTIRLGIAIGVLPAAVLDPQPGWPSLFASLEAMLAAQERAVG